MKALYLLFLVLLSSCSSKYLGASDPLYTEYGCKLSEELCTISYGDLVTAYKIQTLENNKYFVAGSSQWDNTRKSAVFAKIQRMRVIFAFMLDGIVVHTENAWIRGSEGKPMKFDFEFTTEKNFDSSIIIEFQGRVTE
tara:strand:- start:131 stop:544 length:414 start_codon:yes stop_codon:yes gene_type:complete